MISVANKNVIAIIEESLEGSCRHIGRGCFHKRNTHQQITRDVEITFLVFN